MYPHSTKHRKPIKKNYKNIFQGEPDSLGFAIFGLHSVNEYVQALFILKKTNVSKFNEIISECKLFTIPQNEETNERLTKIATTLSQWNIPVITNRREIIRQHAGEHSHQNILLFTPKPIIWEFTEQEFIENKAFNGQKPIRLLILDGVTDVQNFATISRSAIALGIDYLVQGMDSSCRITPAGYKISAGAFAWLRLLEVKNLRNFCETIRDKQIPLLTTVVDPQATNLYHFSSDQISTKGYALVIGSEEKGIRKSIQALGQPLYIPMEGAIKSLNASHATTAFLTALNALYHPK